MAAVPNIKLVSPPRLKDLSVENPDQELSGGIAPALGLEFMLYHPKTVFSAPVDHSPLIEELVRVGRAAPEVIQRSRAERINLMEITHTLEIHQHFRGKKIYLLSLTASAFVTIDLRCSIDENRYQAAALLLPTMRKMAETQLAMSGIRLQASLVLERFFDANNLRELLREGDAEKSQLPQGMNRTA